MAVIVALLLMLTGARVTLSAVERRKPEDTNRRIGVVGESLEVLIIAMCAVFLVIRPFCAQAFYIPSVSMSPTLQINDRVVVNKLAYRFGTPQRNDVIVFHAPAKALAGEEMVEEKDFVKRVIGLPGDVIEVHGGVTYLNGDALSETSIQGAPDYDLAPYVVPPGKVFVLGDNRRRSNDSHRWGALDRSDIIGKATFVFWPPSRFGAIH
jgi:signal peptidase I